MQNDGQIACAIREDAIDRIEYLFMGVIGGIGAIGGAVVGAGSVVVLKEWLPDLLPLALGAAGDFEMIVFGVITVLMLQFAPGGLWQRIAALEGPWTSQKKPVSLDTAEHLPVRRKPVAGDAVLQVKGISKSFGGIVANHEVSFNVHAGEIVALIGPNGAGKTTMFNVISSVLPRTGGGVEFLGRP